MTNHKNITGRASDFSCHSTPATRHAWLATLLLAIGCCLPAPANGATNSPSPITARDFYNTGTTLLASKNFADAEKMFQLSLAAQDQRVQPAAMYNLGHTRFREGAALLEKGPDAQKVSAQGNAALAAGQNAVHSAESALAENQMDRMIASYLEGRGARRELRAAEKAVRAAMESYGKTLQKWQRAADDFRGAAELNPADTNAVRNAALVERNIAKLVDKLDQMQQSAAGLAGQKKQLGQLMSKLKGMIPAENAPPGSNGDEDEDEGGVKPESLQGKEENAAREGEQMRIPLSPDQAGQLLDGLSIDAGRRLPMSDNQGAPPKEKTGRNW